MVSALWSLLLLTFATAAMAVAPAPSPIAGMEIPGEKFLDFGGPAKCIKVIQGVEGCAEQFLESLLQLNFKFFPNCCKAIIGLPLNCFEWIFPLPIFGISFGDQVTKFCKISIGGLSGGLSPPAS